MAYSRNFPGFLPKMWPQRSWNIYFSRQLNCLYTKTTLFDAMRMYLGHICTLVLLPSCHPHCLSYQAFMSRRTKYLSPGNFSPCKADMTFNFYVWLCLFPWHYRDTEYPFLCHARLVCALLSIRSGLSFCIYTRHAFAL